MISPLIPVSRPRISKSNIDAVNIALHNLDISGHSEAIRKLESALENFLNVKHAIALSSGTTALDLAAEVLDLRNGDQAITSSFTIISTISNLARRGMRIKLVDSLPDSWCMDVSSVLDSIDARTRLIIPVHIYGHLVDMKTLLKGVDNDNTYILEDAAEAFGSNIGGQSAGTFGHLGTYSFYANKIVTGGEGGAIVTNDDNFMERARYFSNLCFNPAERFVHEDLGWNYRMNGLSAALITSQMQDFQINQSIKESLAQEYREALSDHPWIDLPAADHLGIKNSYWVFGILLNDASPIDASELQRRMRKSGIDTRRFFCPIHLQPIFLKYDFEVVGSMVVSERLWNRGLYLPFGAGITSSEVARVVASLWEIVG